jgi:heat shock protein HslJ
MNQLMRGVVVTMATLLVACNGGAPRSEAATASAASLDGTAWALVEFDGLDLRLPEGRRVTLEFSSGRGGGQAPCNSYGFELSERGGQWSVGPIASSKMACERLDLEQAYFAALAKVTQARRDGERLVLSGADASIAFVGAAKR